MGLLIFINQTLADFSLNLFSSKSISSFFGQKNGHGSKCKIQYYVIFDPFPKLFGHDVLNLSNILFSQFPGPKSVEAQVQGTVRINCSVVWDPASELEVSWKKDNVRYYALKLIDLFQCLIFLAYDRKHLCILV